MQFAFQRELKIAGWVTYALFSVNEDAVQFGEVAKHRGSERCRILDLNTGDAKMLETSREEGLRVVTHITGTPARKIIG